MKVKEALFQLLELDPEESIIFAYWRRQDFFSDIPEANWPQIADYVEEVVDYSYVQDQMDGHAHDELRFLKRHEETH